MMTEKSRANGWFSRRHQTNAEHRARQADFRANRGKAGRQNRAWLRCKGHDFENGRINCRSCGCPREAAK